MTDQGPATPGTAALDLNKWDTCPCGSPSGPEFRYGLCDPCAERTPASALLRMGQFFGNAALAAPKSTPELERLKAENASLQSMATALGKQCAELERDRDYNAELLAAAEQRNTALEGALRDLVLAIDAGLVPRDVVAAARAALHDEERPAQLGECVGHLGPPSNTAEPHPKGDTCSFWKPLHDEERPNEP